MSTTEIATQENTSLSQLSIKTRIETAWIEKDKESDMAVWVSYPLKQGLKQDNVLEAGTGLEVWVSYPLKQGLKRSIRPNPPINNLVWVSYPLKQGLKLWEYESFSYILDGLSQLSIKTRIETTYT